MSAQKSNTLFKKHTTNGSQIHAAASGIHDELQTKRSLAPLPPLLELIFLPALARVQTPHPHMPPYRRSSRTLPFFPFLFLICFIISLSPQTAKRCVHLWLRGDQASTSPSPPPPPFLNSVSALYLAKQQTKRLLSQSTFPLRAIVTHGKRDNIATPTSIHTHKQGSNNNCPMLH